MFTVKLYRGTTSLYVQGESVQVFAAGPAKALADDPAKRTNEVREVAVGGKAFYISKGKCWAHEANNINVFDVAYIENDRGATTEIVRPC